MTQRIEYPVMLDLNLPVHDRVRFNLEGGGWIEFIHYGNSVEVRGWAGLVIKPVVSNNISIELLKDR